MFRYEGKHLLIDAVCDREAALLDVEVGKAALADMADTIGMTMISAPTGVQFPHEGRPGTESAAALSTEPPTEGATAGYSAFVMLAESHISLHTFPEARFITFDCYSFKDFDHGLAVAALDRVFGLRERNVQVVSRRFPTAVLPSSRPVDTRAKRAPSNL